MTWGLVARADNGGLGTLSWEIARNLRPDRILVVALPDPVGGWYPERLAVNDDASPISGFVLYPDLNEQTVRGFLAGIDSVLCLETAYDRRFWSWCRDVGVRSLLYAMPELLTPEDVSGSGPDAIWIPEVLGRDSGLNYVAAGVTLPWPCSTDLAGARYNPQAEQESRAMHGGPIRLAHQTGRAMRDRNGTEALLAACEIMTQECRLTIYGTADGAEKQIGPVSVEWDPNAPADWRDLYRHDDLLVLPRRYGWLSLPMLEAAASGMACVTTDLHPQNGWFSWAPELLVGVANPTPTRMKGGTVNVWSPIVSQLAARLDRLVSAPAMITDLGWRARAWAEDRSWEILAPRWRDALGEEPPR